MKWIKKNLKNFQVRKLFKPLVYTLILSFLYNLLYLYSMNTTTNVIAYACQIVLGLLGSLGFYFICTMCWGKKKNTLSLNHLIYILVLQAIYIFIIQGILTPLYYAFGNITWAAVIIQLMSAMGIIFMMPLQLIYYYGLYEGVQGPKALLAYVWDKFKVHFKPLLNWFCTIFLIVVALDTLWWGMFSMINGFNATEILSRMYFMGNPMMSWMMYFYMSVLTGSSMVSIYIPVFGCFVIGFFEGLIELNYVLLIQNKCEDHGTKRT